jgi:hypothetical protein
LRFYLYPELCQFRVVQLPLPLVDLPLLSPPFVG